MNNHIYILIMAVTTFAIRVLPLTLIRKKIENQFLRSFLYYVPYVTLAVMTFPAIIESTQSELAGIAALAIGVITAWMGVSMFKVAICCCVLVFILELFLI